MNNNSKNVRVYKYFDDPLFLSSGCLEVSEAGRRPEERNTPVTADRSGKGLQVSKSTKSSIIRLFYIILI